MSIRSKLHRAASAFLIAAAAGLLAPGPVQAATLARELAALREVAGREGSVDVIVLFRQGSRPHGPERLRDHGAVEVRDLPLVRGAAGRIPLAGLDGLVADPQVAHVALDPPVFAATDVAVPATGASLLQAAEGLTGAGVRVAVVDSGVAPVPGLGAGAASPSGRIVAWVDLVEPHRPGPADPFGHGTHVAGIIAGAASQVAGTGQGGLYGGMAPEAEIVSVRVLDRYGQGRASDVIAGLGWVATHAAALDVRVVNLSIGHPVLAPSAEDPLVQACEAAWRAGLLVVTSAGNLGRQDPAFGTVTSPGTSPVVLTVGAADDRGTYPRWDDGITSYSSRGPTWFEGILKPDILAPGEAVTSLRSPFSTLDRLFPENRVGSGERGAHEPELFTLSGSSMAAAMVSGAAALLISADPTLDPDTLKARLMRSAEKREEEIYRRGAGLLDVDAALEETGRARSSLSPATTRHPEEVRLEFPGWDGTGEWSPEGLFGPEALWDLSLAWDLAELWEDDPRQVDRVVWQVPAPAESVVWQTRDTAAPESVVWQVAAGPVAESVVWQIAAPVATESVVWQQRGNGTDDLISAESVVWQQRGNGTDDLISAESVVWQQQVDGFDDWVSAESVVWQQRASGLDVLAHGDEPQP